MGELKFLSIKRGGVEFASSAITETSNGFAGIIGAHSSVSYANKEVGVTNLQRLRIKVNGQLAYDRDGINHTFQEKNLEFTDTEFRRNKAWLALMARKDCGGEVSK